MKVSIVYDTKYGNTKLVAEKIMVGVLEIGSIETSISDLEHLDIDKVLDSDAILIGSPNHVGRPAHDVERFIDKLGKLDLRTKWIAVFDTHMVNDLRAHDKMEKKIGEKLPSLKLITPGLSIKVEGMKGPISEGELPRCVDFGRKIAALLKS